MMKIRILPIPNFRERRKERNSEISLMHEIRVSRQKKIRNSYPVPAHNGQLKLLTIVFLLGFLFKCK